MCISMTNKKKCACTIKLNYSIALQHYSEDKLQATNLHKKIFLIMS